MFRSVPGSRPKTSSVFGRALLPARARMSASCRSMRSRERVASRFDADASAQRADGLGDVGQAAVDVRVITARARARAAAAGPPGCRTESPGRAATRGSAPRLDRAGRRPAAADRPRAGTGRSSRRPTSRSPAPIANSISVVAGMMEMTRDAAARGAADAASSARDSHEDTKTRKRMLSVQAPCVACATTARLEAIPNAGVSAFAETAAIGKTDLPETR